jgi:hypothetical protein
MTFSHALATQSRLRTLVEREASIRAASLRFAPGERGARQRASHARLLEGLAVRWVGVLAALPAARA